MRPPGRAAARRRLDNSRLLPLTEPPMLRRLYDWCIDAAGKPHASWILGGVAFAGKLVLPGAAGRHADPDGAGAARTGPGSSPRFAPPRRSPAGLLGYLIGAVLYDTVGQWLIQLYGYGDKMEAFREAYAQYGAWIILLKGLTPIPYKIVTITSGFAGFNIGLFVILSIISRGMRFLSGRFLLNRYGSQARAIIEKRLGLWAALSAAAIVVGFVIVVRVF